MTLSEYFKIALAVLIPNVGGWINGILAKDGITNWYETLKFPSFRPPNWVFGPVWTILYIGMGYASYLVYRDGEGLRGPAAVPLIIYAVQLALNFAWTPIFFINHDLKNVSFSRNI